MALVKCPECTREISDKAESCPQCGLPIAVKSEIIEEKPKAHLTLVSVGREELLIRCPTCQKVSDINVAETTKTNSGYDLVDEWLCTCGKAFNEVYRGTSSPESVRGGIMKKSEFIGVSSIIQLIGLILLFIFPFGTVAGILLLIIGSSMISNVKGKT